MSPPSVTIRRLASTDAPLFRKLNVLFGEAFAEAETYTAQPPTAAYLEALLGKEHVVALAALAGAEVAGGLVAYELEKFERERSEFYIYDLAVRSEYRRRRIATSLIEHLRQIASHRGATVLFVQADYADGPAIALYESLGTREDVLHFEIGVRTNRADPFVNA
jgi:aminoglycoside 3-N-acetyltransferase I